ncbi:hypothetical protein C8R46DRAFT_997738 [Mycena filopes]|nr:hypothetical protein C8R46DRAFT_997738 [Mycena filopes]
MAPPRSTPPPSPKRAVYSGNDVATYRDLLLFEERLKTTAASLQLRKSRYQLFFFQLLLAIAFLLLEVLLPPHISLLAIPYKLVLQRLLPDLYPKDTEVYIHPYFSTGMLFVSVTTLLLFFASGTYSDKIAYANRYVPHANRALRSFNMYLNVRKPPLRSKFFPNPLSFFFPRPTQEPASPSSPTSQNSRSTTPPRATGTTTIPPMPPTTNPRGELRFSSRVDRAFREGYERYRANFERKRAQQEQLLRAAAQAQGWLGWLRSSPGSGGVPARATISGTATATATPDVSRGGTPPPPPVVLPLRQKGKEREETPPSLLRHPRSSSPLSSAPSIAERRSTPPLPILDSGSPSGSSR